MGAPADQQQEGYFDGNETLTIRGMFPEVAEASFRLPEIGFFAVQDIPGEPLVPDDCVLDTVHLSLDERKLCLTWRYSLTDILPVFLFRSMRTNCHKDTDDDQKSGGK